jgi:AraC family transcriptional regulator
VEQPVLDQHYVLQHLGGARHAPRDGTFVSATAESGSLTIVPAGTALQWTSTGTSEFAQLYFSPALLRRAALRLNGTRNPVLMTRIGFVDPLLHSVLTAMLAALHLPAQRQALYLDTLLETVLFKLLQDYAILRVPELRSRESLAPFRMKRVVEFVEAHLGTHMTLAQLAKIGEVSTFHFSRAFRNSLGETPYQYILRRRVDRAKALLTASDQPLARVASACGFRDARHLKRTFQRVAGVAPGHYRENS